MSGNLASRERPDQAWAAESVRLRRGFSIAFSEPAAVANASSSGPALSTARELVGTTALVALAKTVATSCGPAPWAPSPGDRKSVVEGTRGGRGGRGAGE